MAYFETKGYKISYSDTGADLEGKQPAVVLLHGAAGVNLHWSEKLRKHTERRVIAIDLPGHGRSRLKAGQTAVNDIADFAAIITDLLDELKLKRVLLMGHSMGGMISQKLALENPHRVVGLVLICTSANLLVHPKILSGATDPEKLPRLLDLLNKLNYAKAAPPEMVSRAREILDRVPPEIIHGDFSACDKMDLTDQVSTIACPTLVIGAKEDGMVPAKDSETLADLISGSRLEIMENAGHMIMQEQTEKLDELLLTAMK